MAVLLPDEIERNRGGHESRIETGLREKSADRLIDQTSAITGLRIATTGVTTSALSTLAQPGNLSWHL